jgi:phosphoglycolate phosphatase-like HAD superfamily hydrolase
MKLSTCVFAALAIVAVSCVPAPKLGSANKSDKDANVDPLPSWNEGATKQSIIAFVAKTTTEGNPDYIAVPDRIACFDNDGTLWAEQPLYFQTAFAIYRIKALAAKHPEWRAKQPFKAIIEGDDKTAWAAADASMEELLMASHCGVTTDEFEQSVTDWMATATHPVTGKHFNEMTYQPMIELLDYLRANGYKPFIVSGASVDFIRPWAEKAYGIPPEQIIGSSYKVKYDTLSGNPVLLKLPEVNFITNRDGKPVAINLHIGKRPVFTVGNSDGDYAMLQYTTTGSGPRFGMFIHHTDSLREYAYDRHSAIGGLAKGLDDADKYHWVIMDMKTDWKTVYHNLK